VALGGATGMVWTAEHRRAVDRRGLRYPSNLTDAEWGWGHRQPDGEGGTKEGSTLEAPVPDFGARGGVTQYLPAQTVQQLLDSGFLLRVK
jgi:hypothetical protein